MFVLNRLSVARFGQKAVRWLHFDHRVLSGIQPTGSIHLGNYFGAIKQWVELQHPQILPLIEESNVDGSKPKYLPPIFQIVDLHSLTNVQEPEQLRKNNLEITAVLLGCGIDPKKSILFKQSAIPYHGYLCWILATLTTLPQLNRFPQFKEKSANFKEPPTGLFLYPVLQAADILLYKGTHVPIGDDQLAHIFLTKHICTKFNNKFRKKIFPVPLELISAAGAGRIKSLRHPEQKMSKSEADAKSRIEMTDTDDEIVKKIRKAVTDMQSEITYEPDRRPGVANLVHIYSLISDIPVEDVIRRYSNGQTTFQFKIELAELLVEYMRPIRKRILEYKNDTVYLECILEDGAEKANKIAQQTMIEIRQTLGFSS